jgi:hypothetical protein
MSDSEGLHHVLAQLTSGVAIKPFSQDTILRCLLEMRLQMQGDIPLVFCCVELD